ncbi:nlp-12 [Pristionchus pacificus]|uniref:Nlp-12 n=1 Tax=Pristionchus pacificus TaxID=54126 RepID=A0A2A6BLY4_PRIPA|nr:nlp-12 [Pristionchus pacificus]|eukprot:PDM66813.1 nlp-12 [Pristionchus pacificus]
MILKVSLLLLFVTLLVAHTIPSQTFSREDRDFRPLQFGKRDGYRPLQFGKREFRPLQFGKRKRSDYLNYEV